MTVALPTSRRSYDLYVLGALTATYTLNIVDRGLVGLLLQSMKEDLLLSDTQLGFISGFAFAVFYAVLGVPLAMWADRGNRVNVAALSMALWSLAMMACLAVGNFWHLALARVGAAIGEAGCKPPTYSLVGDYFPRPEQRSWAMAVYFSGSAFATLLAFIVGGWLNDHYGWRSTFLIMGAPGLAVALLLKLTVVEPRTHRAQTPATHQAQSASFKSLLALLWRCPTTRNLTIALILLYTMGYGMGPWQAVFMIRIHDITTSELGVWFGLVFGVSGLAGVLFGGFVASRWFPHNEAAQLRLGSVAIALVAPCYFAFLFAPSKLLALLALAPTTLAFGFFIGPTFAVLQRLVPENVRATSLSVVMLLINLIGMGLGPQLVGILSDTLEPRFATDALRYAMCAVTIVAFAAAYFFFRSARTINQDLLASDGAR